MAIPRVAASRWDQADVLDRALAALAAEAPDALGRVTTTIAMAASGTLLLGVETTGSVPGSAFENTSR